MFNLSLSQIRQLISALRTSNKQFVVKYRDANQQEQTFRCRFWSSPTPVPADTNDTLYFYEMGVAGGSSGLRTVPAADLVSLTINSSEYLVS